MTNIYIYIYKR